MTEQELMDIWAWHIGVLESVEHPGLYRVRLESYVPRAIEDIEKLIKCIHRLKGVLKGLCREGAPIKTSRRCEWDDCEACFALYGARQGAGQP